MPEEKFRINLEKDNNVAILSQSGALGITEIYNLRNAISPKVIVSYGNQLDVDPADLVAYFDRDPEVDVIGCYIEGFKAAGGRKFFNTARQTNTPIIVYKAGRTAAGKQATESHTASIAGEYEVAKAAMKQAGLIVAETMIDHGDFIKTFALLSDFDVRGNRVALIANAGYEKTYAADNLGRLQIAAFDPATHDALAKLLPPYVNVDPLLDLTPMAGDAMYADCIRTMLQSDTVDALMISIVPHSILLHTTDDEIARTEGHLAERIVDLIHDLQKTHRGIRQRGVRRRCRLQPLRTDLGQRRCADLPHRQPRHDLPERLRALPPHTPSTVPGRVADMTTARRIRQPPSQCKSGSDCAMVPGQIEIDTGIVANRFRHGRRQLTSVCGPASPLPVPAGR